MADYDLGTAHGRIVVDYHDKGTGQAGKDLDGLKAKAGELLGKFASLARGWRSHSDGMVNDITKVSRAVGVFAGGVAVAAGVLGRSRSAFLAFKGANQIFSSLGLAMGGVPKGAEGFPGVVKKAIQLSAAITLFAGSTKLLQTVASRFRLLSGVGNLIGGLGARVNSIAGPLHKFAGAALAAANGVVALRIIRSIIKPILAFGGALAAAGATLQVVAGLVTSLKDLSGVAGLLPAVLGAAVFGFAALKIATMGLSDAFKAWDDPAKFAEALKKLHPEAAKAVLAIKSLEGAFKDAQKRLQGRLFDGLAKPIQDLGRTYIPILEERFGRVVDSVNLASKAVLNFLGSAEGIKQSKTIMTDYANVWENLTRTVPYLVVALFDVLETGGKVFKELTGGAGESARAFAAFIDKARESGDLERWIRKGVQAMKDLWGIVKNVGLALGAIWKGLNGGDAKSFLATLRDMTARFNEFIRSAQGQRVLDLLGNAMGTMAEHAQKLGDAFMTYVLPALERFLPIAEKISGGVIDGLVVAMKVLGPIFSALAVILTPLAPVLGEIVKWLVALAAIGIGLGAALKICYSAFTLLKVAVDAFKVAAGVASFATRLLTGNLKAAELQALKFAGAIGKNAVKGIYGFVRSSALIKGLGIVAALAAITVAADNLLPEADQSKLDRSALGSLPDYLNQSRQDLSDYADFVRGILTDPSAELGKQQSDIRDELDQTGATWRAGKAPIQEWFSTVKESFQTDFLDVMTGLPGKIGGWLSGVGESFNTSLVVPIKAAAARVKESFMTDFVGFFTGLPGVIGGALSGLGTSISTAFQGMRTAAQQKFNELAGDAQGLPARIGTAIGSLIGIALKWGQDTWESFRQGGNQKIAEILAEMGTWPARLGAFAASLIPMARQWAVDTWNSFKQGATEKQGEIEGDAKALPGKIGAAISSLASTLAAKASEAWNTFLANCRTGISSAVSVASSIPGRVASAIASLASSIGAKATQAWNTFVANCRTGVESAIAVARSVPGRILGALGNLSGLLVGAGRAVMQGLLAGIKAAVQAVYDFVSGIAAGIAARKGPISYDRKLLVPAGNAIIRGLRDGLAQELPALYRMVGGIGDTMSSAMNMSGAVNLNGTTSVASTTAGTAIPAAWRGPVSGSDGAAAPVTNNYNVTIPAKDIAEMQNVADFFGKVQQKARAGRAVG